MTTTTAITGKVRNGEGRQPVHTGGHVDHVYFTTCGTTRVGRMRTVAPEVPVTCPKCLALNSEEA
jgi:hypothetical protein